MAGGKRGARTGVQPSIFDVRPDNKPSWPTFRGGMLHTHCDYVQVAGHQGWDVPRTHAMRIKTEIETKLSPVFLTSDTHIEHELPNGGLSRGGEPHVYPLLAFELRTWVERLDTQKRTPLYILGWLGGYGKGSILHLGPQFPHMCERDLGSLELAMGGVYRALATIVYGDREWDPEVQKFVAQVAKMSGSDVRQVSAKSLPEMVEMRSRQQGGL
jgi:hypothetical protein